MNESQRERVPVQCPHFIVFRALGIVVGIAGIVVGTVQDESGNLCMKRFVCEHLHASHIQKDPPDLSSVCIQIISRTKYKRNVTGICDRMHHKGQKMTCLHESAYKSTMFCTCTHCKEWPKQSILAVGISLLPAPALAVRLARNCGQTKNAGAVEFALFTYCHPSFE